MKSKKVISILMTLCMVVSMLSTIIIPVEAEAQGVTVEQNGNYINIYANGNPVTVKGVGGSTSKFNIYLNSDLNTPLDLKALGGTGLVGDTMVGYNTSYNHTLYGGAKNSPVDSADITMEGGGMGYVFAGGDESKATVTGDVRFTMTGGTVFSALYCGGSDLASTILGNVIVNISGGRAGYVYGSANGNVNGSVTMNISGSANISDLYGGAYQWCTKVGSTSVNVSGGTVSRVYAGGLGPVTGNTNVTITGGKVTDVYGGGSGACGDVGGNTNVVITGGTVTNVYGGGGGTIYGNTNVTIIDGIIASVYGGGGMRGVLGNTNVTLIGGTITGTVRGDGSNINGTKNGFFYVNKDKVVDSTFTGTLKQTNNDVSVVGNLTVPNGMVLTVENDKTLTVPNDAVLINKGTITNNGVIVNNGAIANYKIINGTGTINGTGVFSVTGINGVPTSMFVGTPLTIAGTVAPTSATNKNIIWSVKDATTTGASFSGNTLSATNAGKITITATIINGATPSTNYMQDFEITVKFAPTITTTTLINGTVDSVYSQTLTATGDAPITWSIDDGSLPTGISLSNDGTISGTPTTTGAFTFTVKATNAVGNNTKTLSIIVNPAPVAPTITTTTLTNGTVGSVYFQKLTATGDAPITWGIDDGSLPTEISLSNDGTISGTPTTTGTFTFTVKATNALGNDTKALSIIVNSSPVASTITTTTLTNGTVGSVYSQKLTATGDAPITWGICNGNLPTGLSLSNDGTISGTPTMTGTFTFKVNATNAVGNNTKTLSIIVNSAPAATDIVKPTPAATDPNEPSYGAVWEETVKALDIASGGTVTHKMDMSTDLPVDFLKDIAGKNSTLVLDMGSYSWSINCKTINNTDPSSLTAFNMKVRKINETNLSTLVTNKEVVQLELLHNGAFNFTPVLKWLVGTNYSGKTIYLNYYNETTDKLEQTDSAIVDTNGYVQLKFTHASKYVLTTAKVSATQVSKNPKTGVSDNRVLTVVMLVIVIIASGLLIVRKRKSYNSTTESKN